MYEGLDKRHQEWLVSADEINLNEIIEQSIGKEFADADETLRIAIAQRLKHSRRFDYGLYTVGEEADLAVNELANSIGNQLGKRLSKTTKRQLNCILANLYRFHRLNKNLSISVSMRNGKSVPARYNPSGISNKTLKSLVTTLTALGFTYHVSGKFDRINGRASYLPRIAADNQLIQCLESQFGWKSSTVRYHSSDSLLIMNSEKGTDGKRYRLDYTDTPETVAISDFIRRYNQYMSQQEIILFNGFRTFPDMIQMRRTFTNGSWESGGRLFGGEYQQMSKTNRQQILINDLPTVEVDIKSCHPTMAFAATGIDWYQKHNREIYDLGTDRWPRDIIKRAFNIMLNSDSRKQAIKALYGLSSDDLATDEGYFVEYKGWAKELVVFVEAAYPELATIFYQQYGNTFMKMEGDICSQVMQQCMDLDIPVLTIHDSFICTEQHKETVSELVYEAFSDTVGVSCVVE